VPTETKVRRVILGGITRHPTEAWMTQIAGNAVDERSGCLPACRYCSMTATPDSAPPSRTCCGQGRAAVRGHELSGAAATEPELERIRGAMGPVSKTRMPLQADFVRGRRAPVRVKRIHRTLPLRAKPSRQRQCSPVSDCNDDNVRSPYQLPRTPRRPASILLTCGLIS
jgi:hypothetical protein